MSTSSATTSRSVSPFQPHQQSAQIILRPLPTLDELIAYLLASKRSLATAYSNINVANTLIATSGTVITSIASLSARNGFLTRSLNNQVTTLRAVHQGLISIAEKGQTEFREVLANLDDADVTMKQIVEVLKHTVVHTNHGRSKGSAVDEDAQNSHMKQQTLHDFVDEAAIETILAAFRECIDEVTEAQDGLDQSIESFEAEITAIEKALTDATTVRAPASRTRSFVDELDSIYIQGRGNTSPDFVNTANAYQALEGHAADMAQLLQSLISHYDFCVKALRYTEGGGEIVAAEQAEDEVASGTNSQIVPHTLFMPEHERKEMLRVLCNDAEEVEDVVNELDEHAAEMQRLHEGIQDTLLTVQQQTKGLRTAVDGVDDVGKKLALYIEAGAIFDSRWAEQRDVIHGKLQELEALRSFYGGFIRAHAALGDEVERRKALQDKVNRIFTEAMKRVERLYEGRLYLSLHVHKPQQPIEQQSRDICTVDMKIVPQVLDLANTTNCRGPRTTRDVQRGAWPVPALRYLARVDSRANQV